MRRNLLALGLLLSSCGGSSAPRAGFYADWRRDRDAWNQVHVEPARLNTRAVYDRMTRKYGAKWEHEQLSATDRAEMDGAYREEARLIGELDRLFPEPKVTPP